MKIIAIVAVSENGIIGKNGQLPWAPIPEDMRRFRDETTGHAVIMGRKTAESLMNLRIFPLENRMNIVVSKNNWNKPKALAAHYCSSIQSAIDYCDFFGKKKAFLIGGENIYREGLQYCDEVLLTRVHETVEYGPDDTVARFDVEWLSEAWEEGDSEYLGRTEDGRASFYKYMRVR